jgi:uncharacterized protein
VLIVNDFLAPGRHDRHPNPLEKSHPADVLPDEKRDCLIRILTSVDHLAVALSGGVDSGLLLAVAHDLLGERVVAVTARSMIHPRQELEDATRLAARLGVTHFVVDTEEMDHPDFLANSPQRCYICKQLMFKTILGFLQGRKIRHLAHGANADDRADYRPGLKAAREMGIMAPLMAAGLTKAEVRAAARAHGLDLWNKPAMACLATRIPYGTPLDPTAIEQVAQAEKILTTAGFPACRVRHHNDIARIEVSPDQLGHLVADPMRQRIVEQLRAVGFLHVCIDLEGYVSGSMNRALADSTDHSDEKESESHPHD